MLLFKGLTDFLIKKFFVFTKEQKRKWNFITIIYLHYYEH